MSQIFRGPNAVDATEADFHVYADGTGGDDANDGLTVGTPKLTLQAALDLIPVIVRHNVVVHCSGTFSNQATTRLNGRSIVRDAGSSGNRTEVIVDGGPGLTAVDDNSGANYSATDPETDVDKIGDTASAAFSVDALRGYWVEVLSGPAAGDIRTIYSNSATTLVPCENFSVDPGVGASFRVVRPETTWFNTVGSIFDIVGNVGGGSARVSLQRFFFDGVFSSPNMQGNTCDARASAVILGPTTSNQFLFRQNAAASTAVEHPLDVSTFAEDTSYSCGVTVLNSDGILALDCGNMQLACCVANKFSFSRSALFAWRGNRADQWILNQCDDFSDNVSAFSALGGASFRVQRAGLSGAAGSAITIRGGQIKIDNGALDVSDSPSHGIEISDARVDFFGDVTGSGNGGAGVYAHSHSTVTIQDGTPPTVTGTVGDVSTDGTTEAITWATLDGGTRLADADEFVIAKEVA